MELLSWTCISVCLINLFAILFFWVERQFIVVQRLRVKCGLIARKLDFRTIHVIIVLIFYSQTLRLFHFFRRRLLALPG